jgi:hypothetical protein
MLRGVAASVVCVDEDAAKDMRGVPSSFELLDQRHGLAAPDNGRLSRMRILGAGNDAGGMSK